MAVAFDAKSTAITNVAATTSLSHNSLTIGASADAAVFMIVFNQATLPPGLTVTWAGVACTQISGAIGSFTTGSAVQNSTSVLFGILAPTTGNQTLAVNWTTDSIQGKCSGVSFTGVTQTSFAAAFPNGTGGSGTGVTITTSLTSDTNDFSVAVGGETSNAISLAATGSTSVVVDNNGNIGSAMSFAPGASTVVWTATASSSTEWSIAATDVSAGGGGGAARTPTLTLMGVG